MSTFTPRDVETSPVQGTTEVPLSQVNYDTDPVAKPVIEVTCGQKANIAIQLFDGAGSAITLPESGVTVTFYAANSPASRAISKAATITDATTGKVSFTLTAGNTAYPGIYNSKLYATTGSGTLLAQTEYWLIVGADITSSTGTGGPISSAEVRPFLGDNNTDKNLLIKDYEWSDSEIVACIMLPVSEFNETNPPRTNYTAGNFPYRYYWLKAASGYLLESAANRYERNRLAYRADETSIDDQAKMETYLGLANRYLGEWKEFLRAEKYRLNVSRGWGRVRGY